MRKSQTACDFNADKTEKRDPCYMHAPMSSIYFTIGNKSTPEAKYTCLLKPNTFYYMSIRNYIPAVTGIPARDACAERGTAVAPKCSGYWQLHSASNFSRAARS